MWLTKRSEKRKTHPGGQKRERFPYTHRHTHISKKGKTFPEDIEMGRVCSDSTTEQVHGVEDAPLPWQ